MARTEAQRRYEDKVEFGGNRLVVLERDGHRCTECEMPDEEHRARWGCSLTVDHVDGNGRGKALKNNDITNLRTLCLPCHGAKDGARADYAKRNTARGARHGSAKLTPELVKQLRADRRQGDIYRVLAERYGISIAQAHAVCSGRQWRVTETTEA